jgi:hypothetical protein
MELMGDYGRGINQAFEQVDKLNTDLAPAAGSFTVNKDNVLAAAQIIRTQAAALQDRLDVARGQLRVSPPGDDDVSARIAPAWNDVLLFDDVSYANRIQLYVTSLDHLAEQCAQSAKTYGYSDEAIAAAFGAESG